MNFLSLLGLLTAMGGAAGAYTRHISPTLGLYLIAAGLAWMALLFFPALLKGAKWGRRDMPNFTLYMGLLSLLAVGALGYQWYQNPLNDLTSNVSKPPAFLRPVYLFQPRVGAEFLDQAFELNRSYPAEFAGQQSMHYAELETLTVKAPASALAAPVEKAFQQNFPEWRIVKSEKGNLHLEAELENEYLHFVDDLVIEARASKNNAALTSVDYRIRNRFPFGDFGLSAKRMQKLREVLIAALNDAGNKYTESQKQIPPPPETKSAGAASSSTSTTSGVAPGTPHAPAPSEPKPGAGSAATSRLNGKLPGTEE